MPPSIEAWTLATTCPSWPVSRKRTDGRRQLARAELLEILHGDTRDRRVFPSQKLIQRGEPVARHQRGVLEGGRAQEERRSPRARAALPGPTQQLGIDRTTLARVADRRPPDRLTLPGDDVWQPPGRIDQRVRAVVHNHQVRNPIAGIEFGGKLRP